jgi:hypothetical protein
MPREGEITRRARRLLPLASLFSLKGMEMALRARRPLWLLSLSGLTVGEITLRSEKVANSYFLADVPDRVEMEGSYATGGKGERTTFYIWNHKVRQDKTNIQAVRKSVGSETAGKGLR